MIARTMNTASIGIALALAILLSVGDVRAWEERDAQVGDYRIRYVLRPGTEPGLNLVLAHGYKGSWRAWKRVLDRVDKRYTVLAPDLLGFGASERIGSKASRSMSLQGDVLYLLITKLGLHPAVLAGNSMGGAVILSSAVRHPEAASGLVFVNAGIYVKRIYRENVSPLVKQIPEGLPVLVVHGQGDRLIPLEHAVKLHESIAGSRLAVIPDCRHVPPLQCPDAFLEELNGFLRSMPGAETSQAQPKAPPASASSPGPAAESSGATIP